MNIIQFDTIDSTNTYLKNHYQELPHLTVVTAKHQTAGRGRMNRSFIDDSSQLLFSILLKNDLEHIQLFPLFAAMTVHDVLINYADKALIKWPNDILVNNLKLCGILTESIYTNHCEAIIIGIGINVSTIEFPDEIKNTATSLKLLNSDSFSTDILLNELLKSFQEKLPLFNVDPLIAIQYINRYSALKDASISYYSDGILQEGQVIEIADNGALHVITNQKHFYLNSGEVNKIQTKTPITR